MVNKYKRPGVIEFLYSKFRIGQFLGIKTCDCCGNKAETWSVTQMLNSGPYRRKFCKNCVDGQYYEFVKIYFNR